MKRYVLSRLRPSWAVRVHDGAALDYETSFVVEHNVWTQTLKVSLFRGKPLTATEWREGAAKYFPHARAVTFERLTSEGFKKARLKLKPRSFGQTCAAMLREYFGVRG
jgi:hypothetical protein